ncbi:hypothetical protein BDR22DRAFT_884922 [Usnea florida]
MAQVTEETSVLIIWPVWYYCLSTTNSAKKNMEFDLLFPSERTIQDIMKIYPFNFDHSLLQTLQSQTPPSKAYYKTPPLHLFKLWAVYLLVLEKIGEPLRIYVGSGTGLALGVRIPNFIFWPALAGEDTGKSSVTSFGVNVDISSQPTRQRSPSSGDEAGDLKVSIRYSSMALTTPPTSLGSSKSFHEDGYYSQY